jgi:hypothetical protein
MNRNPALVQQTQGKVLLRPNQAQLVYYTGSYFSILTNTASVDVIVSADRGSSSACKAGIGMPVVRLSEDRMSLVPAIFESLEFRNPSDTEQMEVEYLISLGQADDTRTVVSGYLQMDLSAPKIATVEPLAVAVDEFSILPANSLIKERLLQNTGLNAVWFGDEDTDPATGRGNRIDAGGSATINCWGAIHLKAENAATRVSVVNILKVA